MAIPLEDFFNDVIGKAQRGLALSDEALAHKAGLEISDLQRVLSGEKLEDIVRKLAPVLNLHEQSLVTMMEQKWRPHPQDVDGLAQFNTPYGDMTVNAYVAWDMTSKAGVAFDTGADASVMADIIRAHGVRLQAIFLTHTHPDHVADIATLRKNNQPIYASQQEPWEGAELFECGKEFKIGHLTIETRQTSGHSRGGVTYVLHGLSKPVAIVGDALFASSMGGGGVSYEEALKTNRESIFTLPDNTVLCPGHGPMTTVVEEKRHNPFYPEFKR